MLFDGGWPYITRERALVLILALIGLGWLLLQTRPTETRLSPWAPGGGDAGEIAAADGLTGTASQVGQGLNSDQVWPQGNPLGNAAVVMTQGYGVGSHAPAHVWGAIDLALDGDNDGKADPRGTRGKPIYATHGGIVKVSPNSWPAGNHVWVINDTFKTGYAHLRDFAVENGEMVNRGQIIGSIGSTGQSSGPHLDYQVWQMQGGRWVNIDPLEFSVFD